MPREHNKEHGEEELTFHEGIRRAKQAREEAAKRAEEAARRRPQRKKWRPSGRTLRALTRARTQRINGFLIVDGVLFERIRWGTEDFRDDFPEVF